jgi:hypothetical protein
MKLYRFLLILCLIVASFAMTGCEETSTTTSLRLDLSSGSRETSRTILPEGQSLEIYSYCITGEGPNENSFSVTTLSPQVIIEGLVLGTWQITATGQNQQGTDLVKGTTVHLLTTTSTRADLLMNSLEGTGNIRVTFLWGEPDLPDVLLDVYLKPQGETELKIQSGLVVTPSIAQGILEISRPAGSYELRYELFSEGIKVDGGTEALRVIKNGSTVGTINLSLDKLVSAAPGLSITTNMSTPVDGQINGIGTTILPNTNVTASYEKLGGGGTTDIAIKWFLDGSPIGTGPTVTFSTFTGSHRLDAIASTIKTGSIGSVSKSFQASVSNNLGIPIAIASITANSLDQNQQAYKLNQVSDAAFLRDGNLLIVSNNTLQLCKVVQDQLVVVKNFTDGGGAIESELFPVNGVTNIVVDLLDNYVFTTAADSGRLVVYKYSTITQDLTKVGYKVTDPNTSAIEHWNSMSNPVLDTDRDLVYFFDPEWMFYYAYSDTGLTYVGSSIIESMNYLIPCINPTRLSISSDNRKLGLTCPSNNSFHLMTNTINGYDNNPRSTISFSGQLSNPSSALNALAFNQSYFHTLEGAGLTLFSSTDNGASYTQGVHFGDTLGNICSLVPNNLQDKGWAVSTGINPGVSLLSFTNGTPALVGFTQSPGFSGKLATVSMAGNLLCVVGSNSDLILYRISD